MRRLALLLAVLALPAAAQGRFDRVNSRTPQGRSTRGLQDAAGFAFFEFAPASGAGMGTACACTTPTGAKGEALTFTRASAAECYSNDGQSLTQCAANQPRVSSGAINTSTLGLWVEGVAGTNSITQSRDLSQAVWTKTSMTCTKTATGLRGGTNTASTCTATAANATVCQSLVFAAAARTSSWHLKRRTGTGAVTLARDGATYGADIASSLSTTVWRRAVPLDTPGCAGGNCIIQSGLSSSALNPTVCLKLATSGDAVDIDFVQDESGAIASSPIETGAAAAARAAELAYLTMAATPIHSMAVAFQTPYISFQFSSAMGVWQDVSNAFGLWADSNPTIALGSIISGAFTTPTSLLFAATSSATFTQWNAEVTDGSLVTFRQRGGLASTAAIAWSSPASLTRVYVGSVPIGGTNYMPGVFREVCVDPAANRCAQSRFSSAGNPIAGIGDSITQGVNQIPTRWVQQTGVALGRAVWALGNTGLSAAVCLDNYRLYVAGKGYAGITVLCGVNSLINGDSAASIFTSLQAIYDEARAAGLRVTPATIVPWASYASSTAPKQTQTLALNTLIMNYCTTNSLTCVDLYNSALNDGSGNLAAGYDSGDHLHPNAAGGVLIGSLFAAAAP